MITLGIVNNYMYSEVFLLLYYLDGMTISFNPYIKSVRFSLEKNKTN